MLRPLFLLWATTFTLQAASSWVPPNLDFRMTDRATGKPIAGAEVRYQFRKNYSKSLTTIAEQRTDRDGKLRFENLGAEKLNWLVLSISWTPENLPTRVIYCELKCKKGDKTGKGHFAKVTSHHTSYQIGSDRDGCCDNLFEWEQKAGALKLEFHAPQSYSECKDSAQKLVNLDKIGERDINSGALNLYKFDDDKRMGAQFFQELNEGKDNPPLKDKMVQDYVVKLVNKIVANSDMPNLNFTATVIDADVMNAFAVPGGYIWVYRGLIERTENEAELVGVLAHEIAHVTSRHGTEGMTSAMGKVVLGQVVADVAASQVDDRKKWLGEIVTGLVGAGTQFWVMGGTRKREAEADYLGAQYAYRSGYDPGGIGMLFDRWSKQKAAGTRLDAYFSDHPSDQSRVEANRRQVDYFIVPQKKLVLSSPEYDAVKKRLKSLPPPVVKGEAAGQKLMSGFRSVNESLFHAEVDRYFPPAKKD